jgi:hypothetical protein
MSILGERLLLMFTCPPSQRFPRRSKTGLRVDLKPLNKNELPPESQYDVLRELYGFDEEHRRSLTESVLCPFFDSRNGGSEVLFPDETIVALKDFGVDKSDIGRAFAFSSLCVETVFHNARLWIEEVTNTSAFTADRFVSRSLWLYVRCLKHLHNKKTQLLQNKVKAPSDFLGFA